MRMRAVEDHHVQGKVNKSELAVQTYLHLTTLQRLHVDESVACIRSPPWDAGQVLCNFHEMSLKASMSVFMRRAHLRRHGDQQHYPLKANVHGPWNQCRWGRTYSRVGCNAKTRIPRPYNSPQAGVMTFPVWYPITGLFRSTQPPTCADACRYSAFIL